MPNPGNIEPINQEEVIVLEKLPSDTQFYHSYEVVREEGDRLQLNIFSNHDIGKGLQEGRQYELSNIELKNGNGRSILQSTSGSSIRDTTSAVESAGFLLTGDTHVGIRHRKKSDKEPYVGNAGRKGFRRIVEYAIENGIDAIIHTGDLFDHGATEKDFGFVGQYIYLLEEHGVDFDFIRGNHDPEFVSDLEELDNVRHIGDGEPVHRSGLTILGLDCSRLSDFKDTNLREKTREHGALLCVVHLEDLDQDCSGIEAAIGNRDSDCYVFAGHHHTTNQREIGTIDVAFTGTPMVKSYESHATAWEVRATDGFCTMNEVVL